MYEARLVRVIDGDTVEMDIFWTFLDTTITIRKACRLYGIDTPETRTQNKLHKKYGNIAKNRVNHMLDTDKTYNIQVHKTGHYGRVLCEIYLESGITINEILIQERLAVPYTGQNKSTIQALHDANIAWHENN